MAATRLRTVDSQTFNSAPKGPGQMCVDVGKITPENLEAVINSVAGADGWFVGGVSDSVTANVAYETLDLSENVAGVFNTPKGAMDIQSITSTLTTSLMKMTEDTLKLIFPNLIVREWNSEYAALAIGSGNAEFEVQANDSGSDGSDISIALTDEGADTSLAVSVANNAITVTLGTDVDGNITSTAQEVVDAINDSADASALVEAALGPDSDGSGTVEELAEDSLDYSTYGKMYKLRKSFRDEDYTKNVVGLWRRADIAVGYIVVLENAMNISDEKSISPESDGNLSGIEVQMRAFEDMSSITGTEDIDELGDLTIYEIDLPEDSSGS